MNHYTRPWGLRFNTPQKASFSHKGQIGILWLGKNAYLRWFVERTPNGWFMIGLTVLAHDFLGKTTHVLDVNPASSVRINPAQNTQRCPSQARKSGQSHPQIGEILRPSITRIWQTKSFVLAAATSNLRPSVYFPAQTSHKMLDLLLSNWNNCVWKWELGPNLAIWGWLGW